MASLSQYILPPLKEKGMKREMEYIFAMQTTSALQQAKEQLEDFPFVRYEFVDIGKSLQEQGLILQSFDVVLCLYTLHSAVDVNSSLLHLQSLLCERGCLLIYEVTDLKFGSLGICRLDDLDRAKSLLSEGEVMEIMARNGFDDVQSVSSPSEVCQSMVVGYKCPEALISNASRSLKEGHNYVIIGRETNPLAQDLVQCLSDAGRVEIVSEVSKIRESNGRIPQGKVVLYIHSSTDEDVAFVTTLLQEIYKILGVQGLWVLTAGAAAKQHHNLEGSSVVGLLRAAGNHIHKFPVFSVDLDPSNSSKRNALHVSNLLRDPPPDHELAFDQDICLVPRVLPCSLPEARVRQVHNWELGIGTIDGSRNHGADDIQFLAAANTQPQDDELMIQVKAAGLNFKDVMMAMGMLEKLEVDDRNSRLGLECCGVVVGTGSSATGFEIGDEVIAFTSSCFASHVKCRPHNVVHKPRNLSWTDSAGIGIVFTTAYYSLVDRAGLKKGETVLIHSACGGVGLAAIQIARMKKANVICSAGTEEKRLFLKTTMGVEHVTDSRSQQFYSDVMEWTGGKGVDVVLNSLHGDLLRKGIDLLAHGGRFCEIGKRDILENSKLLMRVFLENKSFLSCHVDILLRNQPQKFTSTFKEVLQLLENGAIQPIKTTTYSISAFRDTFKTMSKGAHIGKIVFDVSADSLPTTVQMSPKIFKPNATYIITGGFGGIGLALCRWMSQKGAKHLVMVSRHGCHTGAGRRTLAFLKKRGVNVYEFAGDLAEESFVKSMISEVRQTSAIPPIKGIFHLAGVIHEESFSNLRTDHINLMFGSKARSAQHLHHHTLDEPLDVFLLMSSLVTVWGNPAQPSYCAANSALDALACYRHSLGLPALSVQLGPVRGAGFLEGRSETTQRLASKGTLTMHIDDILTVLGQLLQVCDKPVICLANQDWSATQNFVHETSLKFRHLAQNPQTPSKNTSVTPEMLAEQITKRLGDLLNVPTNAIELHQQMTNYGVDSLMAIELTTWAKKDLHVSITQLDVLNGMTAATLLKKASRKI